MRARADENSTSETVEVEYPDHICNHYLAHVCYHGTFVLNKQAPNLQLWLSSPVSGPLRYNFADASAEWRNSRDDHELLALLTSDFETLCGKRLDFSTLREALREESEVR